MNGNSRKVPSLKKNSKNSRTKMLWIVAVSCFSFILLVGAMIYYYNIFVNLQQNILNIRGQIESSFQMRENLVPVLTSTVTNFVEHEDNVFTHTTETRADSVREAKVDASGGNAGLLSKLLAIAEQYPDLKSSEPFQLLMSKIADAETTIWQKRIEYNNIVDRYNSIVTSFPGFAYAFLFGFRRESYFKWAGKPEWVFELNANDQFPGAR
jgi:LemA protein